MLAAVTVQARVAAAGRRAEDQVRANLRALRLARGWSRDHVGTLVALAGSTVSAHESGYRKLRADHLPVYAAAFGVRPAELFDPRAVELAALRAAFGATR